MCVVVNVKTENSKSSVKKLCLDIKIKPISVMLPRKLSDFNDERPSFENCAKSLEIDLFRFMPGWSCSK